MKKCSSVARGEILTGFEIDPKQNKKFKIVFSPRTQQGAEEMYMSSWFAYKHVLLILKGAEAREGRYTITTLEESPPTIMTKEHNRIFRVPLSHYSTDILAARKARVADCERSSLSYKGLH